MVSKAREDLPEPETPVTTVSALCGISKSTFLRLCTRAPRTTMLSLSATFAFFSALSDTAIFDPIFSPLVLSPRLRASWRDFSHVAFDRLPQACPANEAESFIVIGFCPELHPLLDLRESAPSAARF